MSKEEVRVTALPLQGNGWQAALAQGTSIIWRCDHYHQNKHRAQLAPHGESLQKHPEKRSAIGCATVELSNRQEAERLRQVKIHDEGGLHCDRPNPNGEGLCEQWRALYGDDLVEACPHCQDKEFTI